MAQRNTTPIGFSSITYEEANVDKRWYLDFEQNDPFPLSVGTKDAEKAAAISNIFGSNGAVASLANTTPFGSGSVEAHGDVTLAVRIPQTKRLLDFVIRDVNAVLGDSPAFSYDIYVSGRSDKKYTEIVDWVKVCDQSGRQVDQSTNTLLPLDNSGNYIEDDANQWHNKFFPYYSSWIKVVFHDVTSSTVGAEQLLISKIRLHDFEEDFGAVNIEEDPDVEMVFPKNDSKWLPSQTVYFTARVYEPDTDACHFRFEIYKETSGNTGPDLGPGGDTLMYTIDSNALNLDGSENENYKRDWSALPLTSTTATNSVYLPGYSEDAGGTSPTSLLIVPIEGPLGEAGLGSEQVVLGNVKLYDNVGNQLKWDNALDKDGSTTGDLGTALSTGITVPTKEQRSNGAGWLIKLPSETKFNRIDFVNNGNGPTKVIVAYNTSVVDEGATGANQLTGGVWSINASAANSFFGPAFEANIEICWPKVQTVGTFVQTDNLNGFEGQSGYEEGTAPLLDTNPDDYNPDRNGIGQDQTNLGDWTKVHKYSGVMVGPSYLTADTGGVSVTNAPEFGDSPVPSAAAGSANAAILNDGWTTTDSAGDPRTIPASQSHRCVYARVSLNDPYRDGERFYARCLVWDGQTEIVV